MLSIKVMLINYGKFIRSGSSMLIGQVCLSKVMLIERFYLYIKFLESGVEKLQEGMRLENIDSVLKKNQELEDENRMLRGQLALRMSEFSSH
jgi:hypothetical protein